MWERFLRPLLFRLDPEQMHHLVMRLFTIGMAIPFVANWFRRSCANRDSRLRTTLLGLEFPSPVGLAAGFDKNAEWFNELACLGFGFVEVGTLTGQAQPGNDRPRLFRLPADRALINRFGFNNRGAAAAAEDLAGRSIVPVLGVNIGKSKVVSNEEAESDYLSSFERLWPWASYFVINVSSPNTPGLRALQDREPLSRLIGTVVSRNRALASERGERARPILVKVAPDLNDAQVDDIVSLALEHGLDGLIATNTTISRDGLRTPASEVERIGAGGLSGAPLTERSRAFVSTLYRKLNGRLPIIGVGGIMNGDDAWEMIRAGASLVQVYTGFVYGGPMVVRDIHATLSRRMGERGLANIGEVVGEATRRS